MTHSLGGKTTKLKEKRIPFLQQDLLGNLPLFGGMGEHFKAAT